MALFLEGSGCVIAVSKKTPSIKIEGWTDKLSNIKNGLVTLTGLNPQDQDIVAPVVCVDDYRVLYRFGKDFGRLTVSGKIFLGNPAKKADVLDKVQKAFDKIRIANKESPTNVSAGAYKQKVYFVSLLIGEDNVAYHSLSFQLTGVVAPKR